jgi:hypothetical protein
VQDKIKEETKMHELEFNAYEKIKEIQKMSKGDKYGKMLLNNKNIFLSNNLNGYAIGINGNLL